MHNRLRKYLALPGRERAFLLQAALLLVAVAAMLRLRGLAATLRLLRRRLPAPVPPDRISRARIDETRRTAELVRIAARRVPMNTTCLRQSVLLWWLLRRRRLPAVLRLGVARAEGFQAHAWIEIGGIVINDTERVAQRFAVLHETAGIGASPD